MSSTHLWPCCSQQHQSTLSTATACSARDWRSNSATNISPAPGFPHLVVHTTESPGPRTRIPSCIVDGTTSATLARACSLRLVDLDVTHVLSLRVDSDASARKYRHALQSRRPTRGHLRRLLCQPWTARCQRKPQRRIWMMKCPAATAVDLDVYDCRQRHEGKGRPLQVHCHRERDWQQMSFAGDLWLTNICPPSSTRSGTCQYKLSRLSAVRHEPFRYI
jgi:hypothetical protein